MISLWLALGALLAPPGGGVAAPVPGEETLRYSVNWPSGLALGEAEIQAREVKGEDTSGRRWEFAARVEAAIPGFSVVDRHRSIASADLCSVELSKQSERGKRKANERTAFDAAKQVATRETLDGGGKSEFSIPACARDALTYLYYARRELGQGRVPPAGPIFFGAAYDIRMEYAGRQTLLVGEQRVETDRMLVTVKGKVSDTAFEIFFATDPRRTPVMVRAPFALGTFTMELIR